MLTNDTAKDTTIKVDGSEVPLDNLALIVVGIQPTAEQYDRPMAYRLQHQIAEWQQTFCDEPVMIPFVMTDVWYLNHAAFEGRPVITIGHPRHNALTAFLTEKIPVVGVAEDEFLIQVDYEAKPNRVCLWGENAVQCEQAVDQFINAFFDEWMEEIIQHAMPLENL